MLVQNHIRVFISYSWDDADHQKWVQKLAKLLEKEGIQVLIDKKTKFGHNLYWFMENGIRISDVVLMIFTPNYKVKAENRQGGAGYEFNIITPQLLQNIASNEKFIGILRKGDWDNSVPTNLITHKHCDLRAGDSYDQELEALISQIKSTKIKTLSDMKDIEISYSDLSKLEPTIRESTRVYFNTLLEIKENPSSMEKALIKAKAKLKYEKWENAIIKYKTEFLKYFAKDKFEIYADDPENFSSKVFATKLWTVKSALESRNPDLARYKKDFNAADREEIFNTVDLILTKAENYSTKIWPKINIDVVKKESDLKLDFIEEEGLLMNKVIGYGIRSEILHRGLPQSFPVMTQKSLWAMYFVSKSAQEFITIETKSREGKVRISHNWNYNYIRFTFLMIIIFKELEKLFAAYDCKLKKEMVFGYVNMFLSDINDYHEDDRDAMHEWKPKK